MAKPRKPQQEKVGIESISQTNTKAIVIGAAAVIVVLALIAAVFALTNNGSDDASGDVVEFRPVTVNGAPLPAQYSDPNGEQLNEAVGAQAPDLSGSSFNGSPVNITKDGKGKVVLFVAHWCPHCRNEVPLLSKWIPDNKAKYPQVDFYAVATGSSASKANYPPSAWLKHEDWPTPVMADDNSFTAANAYGLGSYPYMVFLDGDNKVVTRTSGELSMDDFGKLVQRAEDAAEHKATTTTSSTSTTAPAAQTKVGQ
jgi:thiol-disulfide isomerase/thioredoxin